MHGTSKIFFQFLKRDLRGYKKNMHNYFINYSLLSSAIYSFAFCYLQASTFFGTDNSKAATTMFVGNIGISIFVLCYKLLVPLLFDFEHNRFIEYQISVLPPRLVIIEKIVFTLLFTFCVTLFFFPLSKLYLGTRLYTHNSSIAMIIAMLLVGAAISASYNMFAICFLSGPGQLRHLWSRCNIPLLVLSGWIPWKIMWEFSPIFGAIALLNPLMYITEGLRQAFLRSDQFLPFGVCVTVGLTYAAIFILLSWYYFKKKTDHL